MGEKFTVIQQFYTKFDYFSWVHSRSLILWGYSLSILCYEKKTVEREKYRLMLVLAVVPNKV